jgi:carbamoyl-phosphate synthase large subunit
MSRERTSLHICLSSAGRRAGLLEGFRDALRGLGLGGQVSAVDACLTAPALHLADAAWQVPGCEEPDFLPAMLDLCLKERIDLIIPTIDTELPVYAAHRDAFAALGVVVAISGPETVAVAADKVCTHAWLTEHGFPTVRQTCVADFLAHPASWEFPLIVKPRGGSAGKGVDCVASQQALRALPDLAPDAIVQEVAPGQEYTINVLVDRAGRCLCAAPHLRLEVRAGEVSKAVTAKHRGLMELAKEMVEALPDAYGAFNFQCFLDEEAEIRVIEINARFGGGYPLAREAGADFPRWLIQDLLGGPVEATFDGWQDGLTMLRYDEAVFLPEREATEGLRRAAPVTRERDGLAR